MTGGALLGATLLWAGLSCTSAVPSAPTPQPLRSAPVEDPDLAQLAALGVPGAGEGQLLRIEHRLHFPSATAADSAALALAGQGLAVQTGGGGEAEEEGEAWLILAWELTEISAERVRERRRNLEILATGYGGSYEGWEVR